MLKMIGSKWFTISHEGTIDGEYRQLNQYIIHNKNGNSDEYLFVDEEQINELVDLLQKTKELL